MAWSLLIHALYITILNKHTVLSKFTKLKNLLNLKHTFSLKVHCIILINRLHCSHQNSLSLSLWLCIFQQLDEGGCHPSLDPNHAFSDQQNLFYCSGLCFFDLLVRSYSWSNTLHIHFFNSPEFLVIVIPIESLNCYILYQSPLHK